MNRTLFSALRFTEQAKDEAEFERGIAMIQDVLGQEDGMFADNYFSGDRAPFFYLRMVESRRRVMLRNYVMAEMINETNEVSA